MVVEVLAPLVDAIVGVIAFIADVFLTLFKSCVRSFRYAFSSTYRQETNEQIENRGLLYRAAYASWGVIAGLACVALVGAVIYWACS